MPVPVYENGSVSGGFSNLEPTSQKVYRSDQRKLWRLRKMKTVFLPAELLMVPVMPFILLHRSVGSILISSLRQCGTTNSRRIAKERGLFPRCGEKAAIAKSTDHPVSWDRGENQSSNVLLFEPCPGCSAKALSASVTPTAK